MYVYPNYSLMKEMFGSFSSHWLGTDHFYFHQRGLIQLKGKLAPVRIYECFDGIDEQDLDRQLKALPFIRRVFWNFLIILSKRLQIGFTGFWKYFLRIRQPNSF